MINGFFKIILVAVSFFCTFLSANDQPEIIDFQQYNIGSLPANWEVSSRWVIENIDSNHILSMKQRDKFSNYNSCYNRKLIFKDGAISVKFRANNGYMDQGGGIMWRVVDKNNYYVARFNPLEDNFRFYKVINKRRTELGSSSIRLYKGWHTMTISQDGNHFMGYIDGEKLLDIRDNTLLKSGGVGVWTKADAKTSFDDLTIDRR